MNIRLYRKEDCAIISKLFYETVHCVNAKDYTAEQLSAWADNEDKLKSRHSDFVNQHTLIAEMNGVIVGFGSIDKSGCLDFLYVHKDYQNQGVAAALCNQLEKDFTTIKAYSSITAKPFFERRGYKAIRQQEVERSGVKLVNFEMIKDIK